MKLPRYRRTHLPSGNSYECDFATSQHSVFAAPDHYPERVVHKVIDTLIRQWNRQQPTTWKYELIEEVVS